MFESFKKILGVPPKIDKASLAPPEISHASDSMLVTGSRLKALGDIQMGASVQWDCLPERSAEIHAIDSYNKDGVEVDIPVDIPTTQEILDRLDEAALRAQEREYQRGYVPEDDEEDDE